MKVAETMKQHVDSLHKSHGNSIKPPSHHHQSEDVCLLDMSTIELDLSACNLVLRASKCSTTDDNLSNSSSCTPEQSCHQVRNENTHNDSHEEEEREG